MLLFTKCKCTWPTAITMSLLAALPTKMSTLNSLMQQNACHRNIKQTFADLLPCYCYAIKTNSRTIRSRISQPTSAGKGGDMSELASSPLHDTITVNLTLVQCEFHTGKKLSLHESNKWIGIKMPASGFTRNIWFLIPISRRGSNARSASRLGKPMRSLTILYQVPWTRPAHLMKRRSIFDYLLALVKF